MEKYLLLELWNILKKLEFIQVIVLVHFLHIQSSKDIQNKIINWVSKIANKINVIGLMNTQLAIKNNKIYVLEVNPRASQNCSILLLKQEDIPIAKIAAKIMIGDKLKEVLKNYKIKKINKLQCKRISISI